MIRLTLLQFRTQAVVTVTVLAAAAIAVAITGPQLAHQYDITVGACKAPLDCDQVKMTFAGSYTLLTTGLGGLILVWPLILGIFLGAPLIARELETGTYRLAWTQSVTRTRWLTVKVVTLTIAQRPQPAC